MAGIATLTTDGRNPFKDDPDLKHQLASLGHIHNKVEFNGWRFSFLICLSVAEDGVHTCAR